MRHETNMAVEAALGDEENTILRRFAERAGKAATVDHEDGGSFALFAAFAIF